MGKIYRLKFEKGQGKTYTFQRLGLENSIILVTKSQGKSGKISEKSCIHPGLGTLNFINKSLIYGGGI